MKTNQKEPLKSVYDENERYTDIGLKIEHEAVLALEVIASKWVEKGYKIREIVHLFCQAVSEVECTDMLKRSR